MNKKYLNGILITLLIVIWSSVVYKYFGNTQSLSVPADATAAVSPVRLDYEVIKDTFHLDLTDRDPFDASKKIKRRVAVAKSIKRTKPTKDLKQKKITTWPTLTYHGFVKGENSKTRLILLKIDNRLYRKRERETVQNITLVKAYKDSLKVTFQNINKTIKRQ